MKKILFLIILCTVMHVKGVIAPVVMPNFSIGDRTLGLYPNYYLFNDTFPFISGWEISFMQDSTVRLGEEYSFITENLVVGRWTVNNDTLLFYQDWNLLGYTPEHDLKFSENDTCYDNIIIGMAFHLRKVNDASFPRNVAAFRIVNNGDSLIAIADDSKSIGIPISQKATRRQHFNGVGVIFDYDLVDTSAIGNEAKFNFMDTLIWKVAPAPRKDLFEVKEVTRDGDEILGVWAKCGNVTFHILNPTAYHQPAVAPFNANREYSDWMEHVRPGQWLRLQLARPNYGDSAIARSLYLGGWPDSVAVMDGEAYGYWFARPLRP